MYRLTALVFLSLLTFTACHKNIGTVDVNYHTEGIVVPDTFDWKTTREVFTAISLREDAPVSGLYGRIDLYNGHPDQGGAPMASGAVNADQSCRLLLNVPVILSQIHIVFRSVSGNRSIVIIPVADTIRYHFTQVSVTEPPSDKDGDKVPDDLDDFPDDPRQSFTGYFPNRQDWGTILFEDIWPYKGDYDLNDLVVQIHYTLFSNAHNELTGIRGRFLIQAVGAGLRDGFGLQLDDIKPLQVSAVTGTSLTQGTISLLQNGLEMNQHNAVIILFDKTDNLLHNPASSGNFFNTWPGSEKGTSDTLTLDIRLAEDIPQESIQPPPYNLFLIQAQTRSIEIHMANNLPTDLANTSLLGTADDSSNPVTGRFYLSKLNIPWSIFVPAALPHTYEQIELADAYLKFESWAVSSGTQNADWYLDLPGYRNMDKIYP